MRRNTKFMVLGTSIAILLIAGGLIYYGGIQTDSNKRINVNIGFEDQVQTNFLKELGAEIKYQFNSLPILEAEIPTDALAQLYSNPAIDFVEKVTEYGLLEDSVDWGVDRVDADIVWGGSDGAVDVSTGTCGDPIKVAVLDTGTDVDHPDLNVVGGYDFVNSDNDPDDDHYHGTHVSGTIAALDDEANPLSHSLIGVAPCVELYSLKVLDSGGSGSSSDIAAALEWTADNGMDIASLSLGSSQQSSTIANAGEYAYNNGVLLVAASGNDGNNAVGYPAANPEFMAVGATDDTDAVADFSNYGPELEISAPGVDIESTTPLDASGGFFGASPEYDTLSGTSMATPHVSAVAALVWGVDTSMTNADVRDILTSTAEDVNGDGYDEKYGYGIVDAEAAVNAVDGGGDGGDTQAPSQVTGLTATAVSSSQIDLSWDAASDDTGVDHYNIYRDGVQVAETSSTSYSDTGLSASTQYTYEVSAEDAAGNEGALSNSASATTDSDGSGSSTMFVDSIAFEEKYEGGWWFGNYYTYATLTILDGSGDPLEGVTVDVTVTFTDGSTASGSGTTDSNGEVTFKWQSNPCGTYHLAVDGLTLDGYSWDTSQGTTGASFTNC